MNKFVRAALRTAGCEAIPRDNGSYRININHIIAVYTDCGNTIAQVQFGVRVLEFTILDYSITDLNKLTEN